MEYFTLRNGVKLSCIGMGTYPISKKKLFYMIPKLHEKGINLIDTAHDYNTERVIGIAKHFSKQQLIISTKLSVGQQRLGPENVEPSFRQSMKELGVKKLGMYLLHFPYPDTYLDCWHEMERLYKSGGGVDVIGVCNCNIHHLKNLIENSEIPPFINQVECHPYLAQNELLDFCRNNGIQMEAYSPFARNLPDMMYNPVLRKIANKYGKSVNQIILRWDYQRGVIPIPQISSPKRLEQNTNIFDFYLDDNDMQEIESLNYGFRIRFNPDTVDYNDL